MHLYMIWWFMIISFAQPLNISKNFSKKEISDSISNWVKCSQYTRLNYDMTYWYEFSCPISSFKNGWNPYFFIFNFHIVMIGIIFSILWIRIILHDSNSWLAGWRTRRYSMTSKLDFYSIFFDSTWNWASVLCINYHFSIRIWTFPWKNHLISYFPN